LATGEEENDNELIVAARTGANTLEGWEFKEDSFVTEEDKEASYSIEKVDVWFREQKFRCVTQYKDKWYYCDFIVKN